MSINNMDTSTTHPLSARPTYTDSQLETFFSLLPYQPPLSLASFCELKAKSPLTALRKLHLLTLAFAPFGSLGIHYSPTRIICIDADVLYHKIVERRHGGYCMEMNCFWSTVLRCLGYDCYIVGARVSHAEGGVQGLQGDGYGGFGHQVVIVKIEGEKWLTDIGFGGRMSLEPIKLEKGQKGKGMLGWWQRLDYRGVADFTQPDHKVWVVDVTDDSSEKQVNGNNAKPSFDGVQAQSGWRPAYCFSDIEWLPADFEVLNYRMCRDPKSMFVQMLIMTRPILDEAGTRSVGQLTLVGNELSRTMTRDDGSHEKEILVKCATEQERVDALEKWFGIELTPGEVRGITGLSSQIR